MKVMMITACQERLVLTDAVKCSSEVWAQKSSAKLWKESKRSSDLRTSNLMSQSHTLKIGENYLQKRKPSVSVLQMHQWRSSFKNKGMEISLTVKSYTRLMEKKCFPIQHDKLKNKVCIWGSRLCRVLCFHPFSP